MATKEKVNMSDQYIWKEQGEKFRFLVSVWDIDRAKRLINAAPRQVFQGPIDGYRPWLTRPKENEINMIAIDWERIDRDKAMTAQDGPADIDLAFPLIVADISDHDTGEHLGYLVIDGWQRMAKAIDTGITELPIVILTPEETRQVREF